MVALGIIETETIHAVAEEAKARLERVIEALEQLIPQ